MGDSTPAPPNASLDVIALDVIALDVIVSPLPSTLERKKNLGKTTV